MLFPIFTCLGALVILLLLLRRERVSLGLPLAYLSLLLLNHVPGAYAHVVGGAFLDGSDATATGIFFTAIGSVCFVAGVWLARKKINSASIPSNINREPFSRFCLFGGWIFAIGLSFGEWILAYGLSSVGRIPSLGAAIDKGSAVWMLGVMFGLRSALQHGKIRRAGLWGCALLVYPVGTLLLAGFLSYGAAAIIIVASVLAISAASTSRVMIVGTCATFLALALFVNYYAHRGEIRDAVWGGAPMEQRIDAVLDIFRHFDWLNSTNTRQLVAMHERLNQNYFVGVAADRIEHGEVDYLYGQSVWEGIIALVPRAIWPEKPVFGGSPKIVIEMTGLPLSENTSWGVGNVMEFQMNFGIPGLVVGFLLLGWLLGTLDQKAAEMDRSGEFHRVFFYFLPAAALIQPLGSLVELSGGAAAALVAAFGWSWLWAAWCRRRAARLPSSKTVRSRQS